MEYGYIFQDDTFLSSSSEKLIINVLEKMRCPPLTKKNQS
ncbi:Putative hypothetical protein [Candidatus Hamiltonella defensa (Bemisia tabaci)]|nr:Putative hypothetical protein [Candidatus Hamiltonella defensa (Bemisia tabaci)]